MKSGGSLKHKLLIPILSIILISFVIVFAIVIKSPTKEHVPQEPAKANSLWFRFATP
jgi:hypothetical protein